MNKPQHIDGDLLAVVREMFPKCIHCGLPCTDPKESVIVERKPGWRRLAHASCQTKAA